MTTTARNFQSGPESRDDQDVKRDAIITIRLSAEEREAWQAAADADQRKLADWIRLSVNATLKSSPRSKKGGK
jgi:hypothetical protein